MLSVSGALPKSAAGEGAGRAIWCADLPNARTPGDYPGTAADPARMPPST